MSEGLQRLELSDYRRIGALLGFKDEPVDVKQWESPDKKMRAAAVETDGGESAYILRDTKKAVTFRKRDRHGEMHSVVPCDNGGFLVDGKPLPVDLPTASVTEPGVVTAKIDPVRQQEQVNDIRKASRELAAAVFDEIDSRAVGNRSENADANGGTGKSLHWLHLG